MIAARRPRPWLAPLGGLYLAGSAVKNALYDRGLWRAQRVQIPVVCIGNLTAGGTGKTPAVAWLANALAERGRRVAVVSRGYGGRAAPQPLDVWFQGTLRSDAAQAGDEAVWLATTVRPFAVVVGSDRLRAAQRAAALGAELIVLDDGYQHRRLHRDLNLLLVDASDPLGGGRGLPAGLLRESPAGARRAGIVLVTRASQDQFAAEPPLPRRLWPVNVDTYFRHDALVLAARHAPHRLIDTAGVEHDSSTLRGRNVYWICGIAQPDSFTGLLQQQGARLVGGQAFPDHHPFAAAELDLLDRRATALGAEFTITTAKDAARWPAQASRPAVITIRFEVRGEALALQSVERALAAAR